MLKLTENQKKLVNEFNKELKSHLGCPFVPSPLPPYYHFHKTLFYNKLKSDLILKGLTQDFYNNNNQNFIDFSTPEEEHNIALKLALYKAPKDFNRFSDQDIKDYFLLYKDTFKDTNLIEKTIRSGVDNLIPDGGRKFFIQAAKDVADQQGFFQGDKIDIDLLKKINFANRDPNLYSEIFSSLDYNMLTPDAWEYTKLTADILNFKESDKIKQRIDEQIRGAKEAEEKRNKHHEELKENFAKQGLDIDKILRNSAEQNARTKDINDNLDKAYANAEELKLREEEILFYAELNNKIQAEMLQKMAAQAKQEEIKSYFNAANDVGNLLIQLGQVTGSKDLQKFGALTVASTQAFYAACQITGSFGVTAVSGIAMINPTTAMISGALAIISIFSSSDEENNAMAEMFDQLFSALNTIHKEMHEQFDLVHRELFQVFEAVHESIKRNEYNFIKVSDKLEAIARFQEFSHKEIVDAVHTNLLSEISKAIYMIKNNKMSEKLDDKLKHLENLDFANNHLAFDNVLNNPDKNPEYLFIDKSIEQQLEARPLEQNVGFLVGYANKTLGVKDLPMPKAMPNPALFYSISSVLPRFLLDIVNQDTEKVALLLKTLEPTIATNDKVINAIKAMKQQNIVGEMLKVYNAELNSFGAYIANENEAYSKALGLPKALNHTLPSVAQAYKDNKIETNSQVLDTKYRDGILIEQKTSSIYVNPHRVCVDGTYIMAEKFGLGNNNIEYSIKFMTFFLSFKKLIENELSLYNSAKKTYTDKATKAEIPLTCPADPRVVNAVAIKLQSLRGDFIDRLTAEAEFKEHILKLKTYEKMAFYYSALTGEAMGVGYAQAFENYLSSAKVIPANEVLVISPVEYFTQKGFWFGDNSTITLALNKWQASNSTYLDFAIVSNNHLTTPPFF